jgi:hypothetical protein
MQLHELLGRHTFGSLQDLARPFIGIANLALFIVREGQYAQ